MKRKQSEKRSSKKLSFDVLHIGDDYCIRDKLEGRILARCDNPGDARLISRILNGPGARLK